MRKRIYIKFWTIRLGIEMTPKENYLKIFHAIFSETYANKSAVSENWLLLWMYKLTFPAAVLLAKCKISPNQITTASLVCAVFSFISIIWAHNLFWFAFFWSLAVLMDLCDGVVARMTGKVSQSAFNFDSMSDIFKICLVSLGVSIRSESEVVWTLAFIFVFFYLYSDLLSLQYSYWQRQKEFNLSNQAIVDIDESQRIRFKRPLIRKIFTSSPFFFNILLGMYNKVLETFRLLLTFNGHTLLVFLGFVDGGGMLTIFVLIYLIVISIRICWVSIKGLRKVKNSYVS